MEESVLGIVYDEYQDFLICPKCLHYSIVEKGEIDECCGEEMVNEDHIDFNEQSPIDFIQAVIYNNLPRFDINYAKSYGGIFQAYLYNTKKETVQNILIYIFNKKRFSYAKDFICWNIEEKGDYTYINFYPANKDKSFRWFRKKT